MILEELSNARGVSGDEGAVRELIVNAVHDRVDEYRVDSMGNLTVHKRPAGRGGRKSALKVVVTAHMDEVGLLITHADSDGRLRFSKVGGIDDRVLPAKVFLIGPDRVPGVVGWKPIHKSTREEREQVIHADDLSLDIGAKSADEALGAVQLGDTATFATKYSRLGDGLVRGKALDDRTGCAVLVELLAGEYPLDLYGVFTVQEEVGSRGARVAGYAIQPQIVIALESTFCDESPKYRDMSPITRLGHGPALTLADRETISDKRLVKLFSSAARGGGIPFQFKRPLLGGTDASQFHVSGQGAASITVSVPTRYIHTPAALLSLEDFENTVRLVELALPRLARGLE